MVTIGQTLGELDRAAKGGSAYLFLAADIYPPDVVRSAVDPLVRIIEAATTGTTIHVDGPADEFLNRLLLLTVIAQRS